MNKFEKVVIKLSVLTIIPFFFFIIAWWFAAAISIYNILHISDRLIAISALVGLSIGIIIALVSLKYLYQNFYFLSYKYLMLFYICLSTIGFASMMGVPILIIILGICAGIYMGRRIQVNSAAKENMIAKVSRFCAFVTGFWALLITIIVIIDGTYIDKLKEYSGLSIDLLSFPWSIVITSIIVLLFGFMQYYLTFFAARLIYAYKLK